MYLYIILFVQKKKQVKSSQFVRFFESNREANKRADSSPAVQDFNANAALHQTSKRNFQANCPQTTAESSHGFMFSVTSLPQSLRPSPTMFWVQENLLFLNHIMFVVLGNDRRGRSRWRWRSQWAGVSSDDAEDEPVLILFSCIILNNSLFCVTSADSLSLEWNILLSVFLHHFLHDK